VAAAFDELADAEPDRFLVIDATQPLDEVVAAARDAIGAGT
jgi:dTMP kinase